MQSLYNEGNTYQLRAVKLNHPLCCLTDSFFSRICNAARLAGRDGLRIPVLNLIISCVVVNTLLCNYTSTYAGRIGGNATLLISKRIRHRHRGTSNWMTVLVCNFQCISPINIKADCCLDTRVLRWDFVVRGVYPSTKCRIRICTFETAP